MNLGVAFGGGGVRSASQLGIMEALREKGMPKPKIYTGTSGGAIVATLLALGYTPIDAFDKFKETNDVVDIAYWYLINRLLTRKPIQGIFKGENLQKSLAKAFSDKWFVSISMHPYSFKFRDELLGVVTTDIKRGKQVIFSNAYTYDESKINDDNYEFINNLGIHLSFAVSASCGLPGLYIPKEYKDMLLVDGGITNNLPSDIASSLGADRVISIDLGYSGKLEEIGGIYSVVKQSIDIMMERGVDANSKTLDIYLNPEIYDVQVLDTSRIDECFERGYKYGKDNADIIINSLV